MNRLFFNDGQDSQSWIGNRIWIRNNLLMRWIFITILFLFLLSLMWYQSGFHVERVQKTNKMDSFLHFYFLFVVSLDSFGEMKHFPHKVILFDWIVFNPLLRLQLYEKKNTNININFNMSDYKTYIWIIYILFKSCNSLDK